MSRPLPQTVGTPSTQDPKLYQTTMGAVRRQLSNYDRRLSRLLHARLVEYACELMEETLFRPSIILGGLSGALLSGGVTYGLALYHRWPLAGSEMLVGYCAGALLGFLIERVRLRLRRRGR